MLISILAASRGIVFGEIDSKSKTSERWNDYSTGLFYLYKKDFSKALEYFNRALKDREGRHRVYFHIADCYYQQSQFDKAIDNYQKAIGENSRFIDPYKMLFNIYTKLNNYNDAIDIYERLIKAQPDLVDVRYSLGLLYYNQIKDYKRAKQHFQYIIDLSQRQTVDLYYKEYAYYHLGFIYYLRRDMKNSIVCFKMAVDVNADNYSTVYILATLLMEQYRIEEAKKYCLHYLRKYPENAKINSYMGRIYYIEDDPRAVQYLRKAIGNMSLEGFLSQSLISEIYRDDRRAEGSLKYIIEKYPRLITPHIAMGKILLHREMRKGALSEFFTAGLLLYNAKEYFLSKKYLLKVVSINDKIPEVYFYLGRINEDTGKTHLAIHYYEKANEIRKDIELIIHLGYLYSKIKDYRESVKYFDQAISMEPQNHRPYFLKGLSYSYDEKYPMAEKYMKMALDLNKNDTYYFYLATVLEKQKKIRETIEMLKLAIQYNPKNAKAYNYLGYLYADNNIYLDESIKLIKKALQLEPMNGAYLDSLGWALYRKGVYQEALKTLLDAEKQLDYEKSPDAVVYDHIGDTYKTIGDYKKAVDYWKKSFQLEKNPVVKRKINKYEKNVR